MFLTLSELISLLSFLVSVVVFKIPNLSTVLRGEDFARTLVSVKGWAQCPLVAMKVVASEIRGKGPQIQMILNLGPRSSQLYTHTFYTHIHTHNHTEYICFLIFPVLLRYDWHTALYKFKGHSRVIWLYIAKWLPRTHTLIYTHLTHMLTQTHHIHIAHSYICTFYSHWHINTHTHT